MWILQKPNAVNGFIFVCDDKQPWKKYLSQGGLIVLLFTTVYNFAEL